MEISLDAGTSLEVCFVIRPIKADDGDYGCITVTNLRRLLDILLRGSCGLKSLSEWKRWRISMTTSGVPYERRFKYNFW